MRERFNFVGSGVTPKDEAAAAYDIVRMQKKENDFQRGELIKTSEEQKAIVLLNDFLQLEFRELGMADMPVLRPERFHVMSDEWYKDNVEDGLIGEFNATKDSIILNRSQSGSPIQLYKTMFHEGVHAVSFIKYRMHVSEEAINLGKYRTGYVVQSKSVGENDEHVHLQGFNEGVVETTVERMFIRGKEMIHDRLGIPKADLETVNFSYFLCREVVGALCAGLAESRGTEPIEQWMKIARGQFTGEMMHLRDIEHAYGMGALRVLDALQVEPSSAGDERSLEGMNKKNEKVLEFFESYDQDGVSQKNRRNRLAQEILGAEDYKKYCA